MSVLEQVPALRVIGGFELRVADRPVVLPTNARRLLAFLAVMGGAQRRDSVAGRLWSWTTDARARATLRTALWRVRQAHSDVVRTDRDVLALGPSVRLDLTESTARARALIDGVPGAEVVGAIGGAGLQGADLLGADLLPGWDEDWLQLERERHRQLRIHGLEALSRRLTADGHYAAAIDVAYRAIAAEPLRESAHRALIRAHLAEGDRVSAARQLDSYARLLDEQLGVRPSPALEELVLVRDVARA
jgi:DNA-binding SARP family transcriptional activator